MKCKSITSLIPLLFLFSCDLKQQEVMQNINNSDQINSEVVFANYSSNHEMDFDEIRNKFAESVGNGFGITNVISEGRVLEGYRIIEPFNKAEIVQVVRAKSKSDELQTIDLILYKFNENQIGSIIEYIQEDELDGEIIFGKDWNRIFGMKNYLLRVNGSCSISEEKWDYVVSSFEEKIKSIYKISWYGYYCKCGFPCRPK